MKQPAPSRSADEHEHRQFLSVQDLTVRYPNGVTAISEINLDITHGEFVCLVGPSGCGKSTLLNAIAGFLAPTTGQILLDGRPCLSPSPERGVVFQSLALFEWLTVRQNLAFGLRMQDVATHEQEERISTMLTTLGLTDRADAYPSQLSGGMRQRLAMGRTLINLPRVLLLDEPFNSLDITTRGELQAFVAQVTLQRAQICLLVTHDLDEAVRLADRVVITAGSPGRIVGQVTIPGTRPRTQEAIFSEGCLTAKRQIVQILTSTLIR